MMAHKQNNREQKFDKHIFRLTYLYSPVGVAYFDKGGNWLGLNPALHNMLGTRIKRKITRQPLQHWLEKADDQSKLNPFEYLCSNGADYYEGTYYLKTDRKPSHRYRLWLVRIKEDSLPNYLLGYFLDVEKQLRLQEEHYKLRIELKQLQENLELAQHLADIGYWVDDRITGKTGWSVGACRIFGLSTERIDDITYDDFISLVHEKDRQKVHKAFEKLKEHGEDFHIQYRINRKDNGDERYIENYGTVSDLDEEGYPSFFGIYRDITRIRKQEEQLQAAQQETELLLKEVHHRIKNNLITVSGLLELKAYGIEHREAQEALKESLLRVKSVSKVHELLHIKPTVRKIQLKHYLEELVESIQLTYERTDRQIEMHLSIDAEIYVDPKQAVPIALLLNELLVNAYEHAFTEKYRGIIWLEAYQKSHQLFLKVQDNGKGLDLAEWEISDSLGHSIVQNLVQQLNATMEVIVEEGTLFDISMKLE